MQNLTITIDVLPVIYWVIISITLLLIIMGSVGGLLLRRYISGVVDQLADILLNIFEGGPVKMAMSVMGTKSGESKRAKKVVEDIATRAMSGPNIAGLKLLGKQIGIDIDELIEDHGPVETLTGLQQLAGVLGIDIMQFLKQGAKGLNTTTESSSTNPYLGAT